MNDLFTLFTSRLDAAGIETVVTGSVAAMLYGEPRLTHDIDLVMLLDDSSIEALVRAFPDEEFYCAPTDVIRVEARRPQRGHFNIIHHETGFKADVYVAGQDPLHRWALAKRRRVPFGDAMITVAPPEYVIVRKLEYYREGRSAKHLQDIRGMLRSQGDRVDRAELESKVNQLGLQAEWAEVAAS
ncbi:nucleotidyl transferase AbiEii/AbiGii toxin family protein [Paraliomyxa miuraensis]|uniref:nucleotidyl transferase AbiEii/AbiGii toxin family protein n=1 Tax=Paraliomyxa miuraensis TaxID=376150 RepID=UPI002252C86D|nr:nucleotidyl transferase AbiEii/AbiGii toxin family protein [Paraliomyxa miuraensis]MCX4244013.1 nucleotidyltransferase family protein [Paraliomyxa miuraensis]